MNIDQFNENVDFDEGFVESQLDIHIRIQQRNRRQSLTIIEGLDDIKPDDETFTKSLVKIFRKKFNCSVTLKKDTRDNKGKNVLQLQGDQRDGVKEYIINNELAREEEIKIHGF
jgi:translation initiation factor 1